MALCSARAFRNAIRDSGPTDAYAGAGPRRASKGAKGTLLTKARNKNPERKAYIRFRVALPLLEVARATSHAQVRDCLNIAAAPDVRNHVVNMPSTSSALVEPPPSRAEVATPVCRSPYRFELLLREALLPRINDDRAFEPFLITLRPVEGRRAGPSEHERPGRATRAARRIA